MAKRQLSRGNKFYIFNIIKKQEEIIKRLKLLEEKMISFEGYERMIALLKTQNENQAEQIRMLDGKVVEHQHILRRLDRYKPG